MGRMWYDAERKAYMYMEDGQIPRQISRHSSEVDVVGGSSGAECLLDFQDYLANVSRLPLWCHEMPEGSLNLQDLLAGISEFAGEGQDEADGTEEMEETEETLKLFDVTLASILLRIPGTRPIRLAEFGCTDGVLSCHLAALLAAFHPENALCCITDKIGNESGNAWLPRISLLPALPSRLSLLVGDYDDSNLQGEHFEIVVVNGRECFSDPDGTLREARRLLKRRGRMLVLAGEQRAVLVRQFLEMFPAGTVRSVQEGWAVLSAGI